MYSLFTTVMAAEVREADSLRQIELLLKAPRKSRTFAAQSLVKIAEADRDAALLRLDDRERAWDLQALVAWLALIKSSWL